MSKIKSIVAAAAFVLSLPAIAGAAERIEGQAQALNPRAFPNMTQIYVASGVTDNGGAENAGVASSIHCTNFTANAKQVRCLVRNWDGAVVANFTTQIASLGTLTVSTHFTVAFSDDVVLSAGTAIFQGSFRIFATAPQITCTAMVIDASAVAPIGTNLHLVRHNAWPNTQE